MKFLNSLRQSNWLYPALLGFLSLIFLVFQFLVITPIKVPGNVGLKFDWPDEGANYYWTNELLTHHRLVVFEPLNHWAENQIHPRSFNANSSGSLVPGSFLGLIILFAVLANFFGAGSIIYFTPFLMLGGVWAFYFLIKKVFESKKIAFLSATLLLASAPWQYYCFESLLPNVPFVSLFLVSLAFLIYADQKKWLWFFFGLSAGITLAIRPSEFVWLAVVYLTILLIRRRELKVLNLVIAAAAGFLALLPSLFFQQVIYGSFLISGYDKAATLAVPGNAFLHFVRQALAPFGVHPLLALKNFWRYFFLSSPAVFVLAFSGVLFFWWQEKFKKPAIKVYFFLSIFVFVWLMNYYGSWYFDDQVTLSLNRLGASYVRYWLPAFAALLPFAAYALMRLEKFVKVKYFSLAIVFLLIITGLSQVLSRDPNNILAVREKVAASRQQADDWLKNIPQNAIIITNRGDKIFFPERRVLETYGSKGNWQNFVPTLKRVVPVYLQEKDGLKLL